MKISLREFQEVYLASLMDMLKFCEGSTPVRELRKGDFGPLSSQSLFDRGGQTTVVEFSDGRILVATLFQEHHYSECTMEPAAITYLGFIPEEKKVALASITK